MKRRLSFSLLFTALILLVAACGSKNEGGTDGNNQAGGNAGKLKVVSSFTIISDITREIGKDHVEVHNLVPTGTDPHEYEPLPDDIKAATDADVLFYNGLNLEGGDEGWFMKLIRSVGQDEKNIYKLTEGVEPMYLHGSEGNNDAEINPHAFISVKVGIKMAEDTMNALIAADPDHKADYEKNGQEYLDRLKEIDQEYTEKIADIPEENRTLVTSERAFQYLAKDFGLKEGFIWEIDTEENGSPDQIKSLISFLQDNKVPAMFLETNVDDRPMKTVSKESGVPIYGPIYSDEIGEPGSEIDTYIKYLNFNIKQIHDGLSGKAN